MQPPLHREATAHAAYSLMRVLEPLKEVLISVADRASALVLKGQHGVMHVPACGEFFDFIWLNKAYVLKKRRWP